MTNWLGENPGLHGDGVASFDERTDRRLRRMDVSLALAAMFLLALPAALGLLVGRGSAVSFVGRDNRVFKRWQIDLPETAFGRLFRRCGAQGWPVMLNIVKGEMAWVGPQALCVNSGETYPPALARVRPGLVGIWDIRRRTAVDFGSEWDANLEYLRLRSVRHDAGLLLRALLVSWMPAPRQAKAERISVADVSFDNISMAQAVARIMVMVEGTTAQQVSFVNPACVNIAAHDRGYRRLLSRAAMVLPDGIGIKIAADLLGAPLKQNVNGTDLFPRLCEMLEGRGVRVFLLGGQAGVADRVAQVMRAQWPRLQIAGVRDGFFSVAQEGEVAAQVRASGADVVLVARGVPMQDVFIDRHLHQLGVKVAIGVGGLFDFVSGRIHRAPAWMRDSGLEWMYRLLQEPSRMWRRYLVGNFTFLGRVMLQRLGLRRSADDALAMEPTLELTGLNGMRTVLVATALAPKDVPVPSDFPAALLPFGCSTFVERAVEQLANHGVRHIDVVASARPEALRQLLGLGERWGVQLRWHLAKDSVTPYGLLRSLGLTPGQRVLLGHAHTLVADRVLSSLIQSDQVAAIANEHAKHVWIGWASTSAELLSAFSVHGDESAMGSFLCSRTAQLIGLDACDLVSANSADELLHIQHLAMTPQALDQVPAVWLKTPWGAHSPQAVIQAGAVIKGPVLIGPGCFIATGASVGPNTLLTHDVVVSAGATIRHSLVLPHTFVGRGLELDNTVVNGRSVQHLRLGVKTVLPASDGLLLELQPQGSAGTSLLSRSVAIAVCLFFSPWLVLDTGWRRLRGLPLRWCSRLVALGRDGDTGEVRLQTLRCPRSDRQVAGQLLAHYGAWMDVAAGRRTWFGTRPRSQSEWYALGREWQLLLAKTPVGCMHAPAWSEGQGETLEARAAADVFYAANPGFSTKLGIVRCALRAGIRRAMSANPKVS